MTARLRGPGGLRDAGVGGDRDALRVVLRLEGIPYEDTEFDGRSDYQAFADAGIPSGGLFSGAEDIKTAEQRLVRRDGGGAFDPCYHQACDNIDNISDTALDQNSDAVAFATLTLAMQGNRGGKS